MWGIPLQDGQKCNRCQDAMDEYAHNSLVCWQLSPTPLLRTRDWQIATAPQITYPAKGSGYPHVTFLFKLNPGNWHPGTLAHMKLNVLLTHVLFLGWIEFVCVSVCLSVCVSVCINCNLWGFIRPTEKPVGHSPCATLPDHVTMSRQERFTREQVLQQLFSQQPSSEPKEDAKEPDREGQLPHCPLPSYVGC